MDGLCIWGVCSACTVYTTPTSLRGPLPPRSPSLPSPPVHSLFPSNSSHTTPISSPPLSVPSSQPACLPYLPASLPACERACLPCLLAVSALSRLVVVCLVLFSLCVSCLSDCGCEYPLSHSVKSIKSNHVMSIKSIKLCIT